jgi:DNA-binding response OmpR family regulator
MKRILLIYSDPDESAFIADNLKENGVEVKITRNFQEARVELVNQNVDLAVINLDEDPQKTIQFLSELKKSTIKSLLVSDSHDLKTFNDLKQSGHHFVIIALRPKLILSIIRGIMNKEELNWLPAKIS